MEWTSNYIQVWFFPRGSIPSSIAAGTPNTSQFGTPIALFEGNCQIDQHFAQHNIVFDIDFCGDYAGNAYGSTTCPQTTNASSWDSCVDFVGNNPQNFTNAYFLVNSLVVYTSLEAVPAPTSTSLSSVTPVASTGSPTTAAPMGVSGTA